MAFAIAGHIVLWVRRVAGAAGVATWVAGVIYWHLVYTSGGLCKQAFFCGDATSP